MVYNHPVMTQASYSVLKDRGLLSLAGGDACVFLQGLVSNDVDKIGPARAVHAAFLTPQGKYLHDFFILQIDGALLLDCEGGRLDDLKRRLSLYKLRADVALSERTADFAVAALFGEGAVEKAGLTPAAGSAAPFLAGVAYVDPRLAAAGGRAVVPAEGAARALEAAGLAAAGREDYDAWRLGLGLPDGSRDMTVEKALLLENGFNEMGSVDWDKGCYLGQELTARTNYRGLLKKRLVPVAVEGPLPEPQTPLLLDGEEAGEMKSGRGDRGLALIRIEHLEKAAASGLGFTAAGARLTAKEPAWATIKAS